MEGFAQNVGPREILLHRFLANGQVDGRYTFALSALSEPNTHQLNGARQMNAPKNEYVRFSFRF